LGRDGFRRAEKVVELCYFGGLTLGETADSRSLKTALNFLLALAFSLHYDVRARSKNQQHQLL
jgi:hypothetical protein